MNLVTILLEDTVLTTEFPAFITERSVVPAFILARLNWNATPRIPAKLSIDPVRLTGILLNKSPDKLNAPVILFEVERARAPVRLPIVPANETVKTIAVESAPVTAPVAPDNDFNVRLDS